MIQENSRVSVWQKNWIVCPFLHFFPSSSFRKSSSSELVKFFKVAPLSASAFFYCSSVLCRGKAHRQLQWPECNLAFWALPHWLIFLVFSSTLADFNISFSSKKFSVNGAKFLCWTKSELPKLWNQEWACSVIYASLDEAKSCFEVNTVGLKLLQLWEEPVSVRWAASICFQRGLNTGVSGLFHSCCSSQGTKIWIYLR